MIEKNDNRTFLYRASNFFFYTYIIALYLFDIKGETIIISKIAFILFAGFTALHIMVRNRYYFGLPVFLAYCAIGWIFASCLWAHNRYYSMIRAATLWQIFVLFYLVHNLYCREEAAHKTLIKALYIAGIAFCGYTIYIYGISGIIDAMTGGEMVRLGPEVGQANVYGMHHATTSLIAIFYLLNTKRYKNFHIVVLISSFVFSMSSGSRKALLIVIIGSVYLIFKKYGIKKFYKTIFVSAIVVIVFSIVIQTPMLETVRVRTEKGINSVLGEEGGDSSADKRLRFIDLGLKLFKERPFLGWGINNYFLVSKVRTYSHNNFIEILVGCGAIGFVIYYLLYIAAFKRLKNSKREDSKFLLVLFIVNWAMEMAMVTYYDKVTWIMLAFFLIDYTKIEKQKGGDGNDPMQIEESIEKT